MTKIPTKRPVFLDFFAGCGGLSLGLEEAGFYPLYVNELNADARATYLANRRDVNPLLEKEEMWSGDIGKVVTPQGLKTLKRRLLEVYGIREGQIDLIAGGPPCQGYSAIGHRRSYAVDKEHLPSNFLFEDYATVIEALQPSIFLFENVKGLLSAKWKSGGKPGEIWEKVLATFRGIKNYDVAWSLVQAKSYGVPQNRPRVIIVGVHKRLGAKKPVDPDNAVLSGYLPAPSKQPPPDLADLLGDLVDKAQPPGQGGSTQYYPSDPQNDIQAQLRTKKRSLLGKGARLTEQEYSTHAGHVLEKFNYMINNKGKIPEHLRTKKFAQRLLPAKWDKEGPTITATSLPDDYCHYLLPRILTVREWARLQCFPDWYEFSGKRTTGGLRRAGNPREGVFDRELPKYTQIGNAVPVWLARAIGLHFKKRLLAGKGK